jgi:hypothetical protein
MHELAMNLNGDYFALCLFPFEVTVAVFFFFLTVLLFWTRLVVNIPGGTDPSQGK